MPSLKAAGYKSYGNLGRSFPTFSMWRFGPKFFDAPIGDENFKKIFVVTKNAAIFSQFPSV